MIEITLENLTKIYGSGASAAAAVDGVALSVKPGELFFLLGPSGCGKTTLLRIIAGLVAPTAGRVLFDGRNVTLLPAEKRNTAMVFQNYALWPHMTVAGNVQFGPKMRGAGRRRRRELAEDCLERVRMRDFAGRKPNQLSGGQQQRVALARALAARGDCLLLDEPLSNLDARLRMHMRDELRQLVKETGITAVYVTHDQKEALCMADRIAVMKDGRIVQIAVPNVLYNRPATRFVADFLGEANFIDGEIFQAGAPAKIQTTLGVLLAAGTGCPPEGTKVTCCVRPERITIARADAVSTGENVSSLPAKIETSTYLGEVRTYLCRLEGGLNWKVCVLAARADDLAPGRDVVLHLPADGVNILAE